MSRRRGQSSTSLPAREGWDEKLIAVSVFYTGCVFKAIDSTIDYFESTPNPGKPPMDIGGWDISAAIVLLAYLGWLALHFYRSIYRYFPEARRVPASELRAIQELVKNLKRPRLFGYAHLGVSLGLFYLLATNLGPPDRNQAVLAFLLILWDLALVLPFTNRFYWLKEPWLQGNDSKVFWWTKNIIELVVISAFYRFLPPGERWLAVTYSVIAVTFVAAMAFGQHFACQHTEKTYAYTKQLSRRCIDKVIDAGHSPLIQRHKLLAICGVLLLVYLITSRLIQFPSNDGMIQRAREFYADYGYRAAFVAAFVEALIVIGWYAPGSVVVVLGAAFSAEGVLSVWWFTAAAIAGFFAAYCVNYLLGRIGWYRVIAKLGAEGRVEAVSLRINGMTSTRRSFGSFLMYFSPNIGGLWSSAHGVLKTKPLRFAITCLIGTVFWSVFWSTVAYFSGHVVLDVMQSRFFILLVLASFVLVIRGL